MPPVAIVAPEIVALRLRLAMLGTIAPAPLAGSEYLDIGRDAEREPLAPGQL